MLTMSATEVAEKIGREHRRAYRDEFGDYPERGNVGDWDVSGAETMEGEVRSKFNVYDRDEVRDSYLGALFDDAHERVCAYCNEIIGDEGKLPPPPIDDDHAWTCLARSHAPGCEWVRTRAHRLDMEG